MNTYLERTACTGSRPLFVEFYDHHIPSSLMRTVHASRGMPCFIVASSGFGKTSFSAAYAKRYFGFKNVYWFDAADARFPFLLDASQLYDYLYGEIRDLQEDKGLVVFDEVPLLTESRTQALSTVIDLLIKSDWEVIVTLLPSHDSFEELQPDRLLINARRLLGTDNPDEEQRLYCLRSFFRENLPSEFRRLAAAILLLQKGSTDDLAKIGIEAREDVLRFLETSYPMFGINNRRGLFDAWKIDPVALHNELLDALPKDETGDLDRACFARLIDVLVQKGCSQQAYQALRLDQEDEPLFAPRVADLVSEETVPDGFGDSGAVPMDAGLLPAEPLPAQAISAELLSVSGSTADAVVVDAVPVGEVPVIIPPCDERPVADALSGGWSSREAASGVAPSSNSVPSGDLPSPSGVPSTGIPSGDRASSQTQPSLSSSSGHGSRVAAGSALGILSVSAKERLAPMYVRLFGGFEVSIGDRIVGPKEWRKNKAKLLLSHLVLGFGHEVPRSTIIEQLWPSLDSGRAVENFYVVWSRLRRVLTGGPGDCPYVTRIGSMFRVEPQLVSSDVLEFERLARSIVFEQGDQEIMMDCYLKMESLYRGQMYTGDIGDETLELARLQYHNLLVNTMVAAAEFFINEGNFPRALWFANNAMKHENDREDIYRIKMQAEALSGQRTMAMETFFELKRRLAEGYGVAPSEETVRLYEELVLGRV